MVSPSPGARVRAHFRSIFLSDTHLGSPRAQAELLLDFLARHRAEYLYLVGDIADDIGARPPESWPVAHREVVVAVHRMAREGTRVQFMAGNHDPLSFEQRSWEGLDLAESVAVVRELEHVTADGRRLWVVHGTASTRSTSAAGG